MQMTAKQFRDALDRLGLSQLAAARLLGVDGRTARAWALDERQVPGPIAVLLRLMLDKKITAADVNIEENLKQSAACSCGRCT